MNINNLQKQREVARSLFENNNLIEAKKCYIQLCKKHANTESYYMLGIIYGMTSEFKKSEDSFKKSLKFSPDNDLVLNNLAIAQIKQGKLDDAEKNLKKSIAANNNNSNSLIALGNIYREKGDYVKAEVQFKKALTLDQNNPALYNNIGNLYLDRCVYDKAIEYYQNALRLLPNYLEAYFNLGSAYQSTGDYDHALEYYNKAHELNPHDTRPITAIVNAYEKTGLNNKALDTLNSFANDREISPDIAYMYGKIYLNLEKYTDGINIILKALETSTLQPIQEQELRFCLGELYDKYHDYELSFKHFDLANKLRPYNYSSSQTKSYFSSISKIYKASTVDALPTSASQTDSPIFILGMPRSGTSLIEQILSSHHSVYGAGELPLISDIIKQITIRMGEKIHYPYIANNITPNILDEMVDFYIDKSRLNAGNSRFVTDKMPHNFLYIGIIFQLFPKCKIIHVSRNPIDVCLSIYFHNFNINHPYSDKLENIADYYIHYHKLMEHWRAVYGDRIMDIQYESLISEPEAKVKSLLDYVDLEWDDNCLRFYDNSRNVNTPSYSQVRQPLYTSSMNRWKNYALHVNALQESLKDYITAV